MGSVSTQKSVDLLQAVDQIDNLLTIHWATGRLTKMGSAAEGAGFIDQTFSRAWLEHGTSPIARLRK